LNITTLKFVFFSPPLLTMTYSYAFIECHYIILKFSKFLHYELICGDQNATFTFHDASLDCQTEKYYTYVEYHAILINRIPFLWTVFLNISHKTWKKQALWTFYHQDCIKQPHSLIMITKGQFLRHYYYFWSSFLYYLLEQKFSHWWASQSSYQIFDGSSHRFITY